MLQTDLICPLYKAEDRIEPLIHSILRQKQVSLGNVVFPITDTGDVAPVVEIIQAAGFQYFLVAPKDFSHSLTREKAVYEYCSSDIVIMLSQDVVLTRDDCFYHLAKHISGQTVYSYGRQTCPTKTIEYYTRLGNYGPETFTVRQEDIEHLQLRAFSASDAFAAYNRKVFLDLEGYDHIHMMFNEDMYFVKKALEAGYQKVYAADAVVEHSHTLTLKQLYQRYHASGAWFKEHPEFDNYKTTDTGVKLAIFVARAAIRDRNIPVLIRFLPDMAARYLGMKMGRYR